jgi:glutamyl-tRNA synthetase
VRGNEYLSSAPKYNRLYEAFGWEVPTYVHCPLITDEEHHKLSKRSGHSSFEDLIDQGFVTEAVINYVALLGWSPSDDREIFSLEELVEQFDYHHMSKSPAVFDIQKLKWMNGEYIKSMDFEQYAERAIPQIRKTVSKELDVNKIAAMVKTRIEVFPDIDEMVGFFEMLPDYDISLYQNRKWKVTPEKSLGVLTGLLPMLESQKVWENDSLYEVLKEYSEKEGVKAGFTIWPVRIAVSGKSVTPAGATEIMEVIGKEESLARIREGIRKLTDAQ